MRELTPSEGELVHLVPEDSQKALCGYTLSPNGRGCFPAPRGTRDTGSRPCKRCARLGKTQ